LSRFRRREIDGELDGQQKKKGRKVGMCEMKTGTGWAEKEETCESDLEGWVGGWMDVRLRLE